MNAAADARARNLCADAGPWACDEAECPAPEMDCAALAAMGVCANGFGDVWDTPPAGTAAALISDLCPRACGKCQVGADPRDEL